MIKVLKKEQNGSVLLYSLLVISLITAIAIIISIIVVNEIRLTSAASNGVQAYYAAESGIEKGLYAVKVYRSDQEVDLQQAANAISAFIENNFENNASFENMKTDFITAKVENVFVEENDYIQIDYYDVSDPLNPDPDNIVYGIRVRNDGDDPATWAEVSWTAWDDQGVLGTSTIAKKVIGPSDLSRPNGWPINNLDVFSEDDTTGFDGMPVGYRVRIKALKAIPSEVGEGNLSSLTVIPYSVSPQIATDSDIITDLPTQLVIKSVGDRNDFKQSLVATVPWQLPLFGLYDYVLFSESEILKDIVINPPTYTSGIIEIESSIDPADRCIDQDTCTNCTTAHNWDAICTSGAPLATCYGENNMDDVVGTTPIPGQCKISPQVNMNGFYLPIPDTVPEGENYYLSYRAFYDCGGGCVDRDLTFEINGSSVVVNDPVAGQDEVWHTCTVPDTFILGEPSLPMDDPARVVAIMNYPIGNTWTPGDIVRVDWYQLSTYKVFPDCY